MDLYIGGGTSAKSRSNICVGVVTLNQFVLDFENNSNNILSAIKEAHANNVKVLGFPELCVSSYSCQDHFYERETFVLAYYMLKNIVHDSQNITKNMVVAVGCPIMHRDVRYNCTVFFSNGKIILIRPKTILADDGNYRESRWFTPWTKTELEDFYFDDNNDTHYPEDKGPIPFGLALINCNGILIGAEICEELWVSDNIGSKLYLAGADIIINPSASHYEKGKQEEKREVLIKSTTRKSGGVYIYSNLEGCDGERLYFDGGSLIAMNGEIKCTSDRFLLKDIQLTTCNVNLDDIITYRSRSNAHQLLSSKQSRFPEINVDIELTEIDNIAVKSYEFKKYDKLPNIKNTFVEKYEKSKFKNLFTEISSDDILLHNQNKDEKEYRERMKIEIPLKSVNEICNTAACWLFDYLERSGSNGFLLTLNGDSDTAATACIVFRMCELILRHIHTFNDPKSRVYRFLKERHNLDIKDLLNKDFLEATKNICSKILFTVFLPTYLSSVNIKLASEFAEQLGTNHKEFFIDKIVENCLKEITKISITIIQNEIKFNKNIIKKKLFIKNNISIRDTDNYNKKIIEFNTTLDNIRQDFLSNYNILKENEFNELTNSIYSENSKPSSIEISPYAKTVFEEHKQLFTILNQQNKLSEKEINDLKQKFKKDFETLNSLYTNYKNNDYSNITKSTWETPLKNLKARINMVMTYLIGQLSDTNGNLLNLGSANLDEVYTGHYTKYDTSSADLNPIGSLPKIYIQRILIVFGNTLDKLYGIINKDNIYDISTNYNIDDDNENNDNGLKFMEISELSFLLSNGYGPLDSFMKIATETNNNFISGTPKSKLEKIQNFYNRYRLNRHKAIILPPSVHLLSHSADDNRYNMRPFIYPNFTTSLENEILKGLNI